jgi:hypothetical protein
MNNDGIIVGANGITIRLNGFRLQCKGVGYGLSCQGGDQFDVPDPQQNQRDIGIDINGFSNVTVTGGGAIQGFDTGVRVSGPSSSIEIEKLNITGPDADLGTLDTTNSTESAGSRPDTEGILVRGTSLSSAIDIFANSVDNHTAGIKLENAKGVEIRSNFAHDNNGGVGSMPNALTGEAHGIHVLDSTNNVIHNNLVIDNGVNITDDSGIILDGASFNNRVNSNNVSFTNGDGISVRGGAANNVIDANQVLYNTSTETIPDPSRTFFDLAIRTGGGANTFNANNRCETESADDPNTGTKAVPANVCNSGEGEPWIKNP